MKNIFRLIVLTALVAVLASCKKEKGVEAGTAIVAEWHLEAVSGLDSGSIPEVYIDFRADKSFDLYQKTGEAMRYSRYTGTYTVTGSSVTGVYSDGVKWGGDTRNGLSYSLSFDGDMMEMTAENGSSEVCTYRKASLAQNEKDAADLKTKASEESEMRFL